MDAVGTVVEDLDAAVRIGSLQRFDDGLVLVEVAKVEKVAQVTLGANRPRAALWRAQRLICLRKFLLKNSGRR